MWKIGNFKSVQKNTLQGFFELEVGCLKISGFTYHRKNGKTWIGMPSKEYEKDGETKYWPIVWIEDKKRLADFQRWACSELEKIAPPTQEVVSSYTDYIHGDDIPF